MPKKVVLLVEDTDSDRELYGGLLWYNGYDVAHAMDGEAAIARAREIEPDLVLLDMMLPGDLDGIEVARRLREAGVVAFLEKPIDPFAVVLEVIRWIGYARPGERGEDR